MKSNGNIRRKSLRMLTWALTFLWMSPGALFAQAPIEISGEITDVRSDEPLQGVSIVVKGSPRGTTSDQKGVFHLTVNNEEAVLQISFAGYTTQEIPVKGNRNIVVVLSADAAQLNDVIVVGYGTQRKGEVTSAITSLKPEDFNKGNIINPIDLL